jgi:uncharacterized protein YndB with AHSA1/START domain
MEKITIKTSVIAPLPKVWDFWTSVIHIKGWAFASDDWGAEGISNQLLKDGVFSSRMFAKDGSFEFLYSGKYIDVVENKFLEYTLDDGRNVTVSFAETSTGVAITQSFEPEPVNSIEMQRDGWQAYLDNFKKYVESN